MPSITMYVPTLPPSVNHLYVSKGRYRFLSAEGRAFKQRFVSSRGGLSVAELAAFAAQLDRQAPAGLEIWVGLPASKMFNTSPRARYKYADRDVSNFIKVVEDALSEMLNMPDRNNLHVLAHKLVADTEDGFVLIRYSQGEYRQEWEPPQIPQTS